MDAAKLEREVDANYDAFVDRLPELLSEHANQTALMRRGDVVAFYPNIGDALAAGRSQFADGLFSVQEITDQPLDLGLLSHAVDPRIA